MNENEIYVRIGGWDDRNPWRWSRLGVIVANRLVRTLQCWPNCACPPGIGKTFDNDRAANIIYKLNKRFLLRLLSDVVTATDYFETELPESEWEELDLPARLWYAILLSSDVRRPPVRGGGGNTCMMCPDNRVDKNQMPWIDISDTSPTVHLEVRNSNDRGHQWFVTSVSVLPGISSFAPRYCHIHLYQMKRLFKTLMASPIIRQTAPATDGDGPPEDLQSQEDLDAQAVFWSRTS